ncbi:MAG: serine hydrolase domain-containing protein [Mycobacterium sp.]
MSRSYRLGVLMSLGLRRGLAALTALALVSTGCSGHRATDPVAPVSSLAPVTAAKLDDAIGRAMTTAVIPGAMVGVWSPDGDYVKAFGVADTATGSPMKADFYSRIGSVTKTFTATAVLQLVDEGKVGLDDPIARYVDGVPDGRAITVRQLAGMRSGLVDYTETDGFDAAVAANPQHDFTPTELLGWAFAQPAEFAPGQKFKYSNTNYILLGLLVEKVSGKSFADFLTDHILAPLDLVHTSFPSEAQFPEPHAQGYTEPIDGDGPPIDASDWSASFTWAAGAIISTLEDMRIWVPAVATGRLLSPELQEQRLRTDPAADVGYGLGLFTVAGWIGHNGSVPGYQTVAVYLPARQITLVVMINTDIAVPGSGDPSGVLANAITTALTPDHVYKL